MDSSTSAMPGLLLLALAIFLYFIPAIVARNKRSFGSVTAINLFLGWTIVGWVVALAWALKDDPPEKIVVHQIAPLGQPILCGFCGRYLPAGTKFCGDPGRALSSGISAVAILIVMLAFGAPVRAQGHPCGPGGAWNCVGDTSVGAAQPVKAVPAAAATAPADRRPGTPVPLPTKIEAGSTVFVEPMSGFENYLLAAMQKKKVMLTLVANEDQAAYVIKGTWEESKAGWAKIISLGQIHSDDAASVQLIDIKSGAILFAYAVNKKNTWHGDQTTAEACAKHLKELMAK